MTISDAELDALIAGSSDSLPHHYAQALATLIGHLARALKEARAENAKLETYITGFKADITAARTLAVERLNQVNALQAKIDLVREIVTSAREINARIVDLSSDPLLKRIASILEPKP